MSRFASLFERRLATWRRFAAFAPFMTRLDRAPATPAMRRLHAMANRYALAGRHPITRLAAIFAVALSWPVLCAVMVALQSSGELRAPASDARTSLLAYRYKQWLTCLRWRIPVPDYLTFSLHKTARLHRIGDYIIDVENLNLLAQANRGRDVSVLQNKLLFWRHCTSHHLPAIPVLAVADQGTLAIIPGVNEADWSEDLILKPLAGHGGAGIERWESLGGSRYRSPEVGILSLQELQSHIALRSETRRLLVQPRVCNDPETSSFSNGSLATVRVLTGRMETGERVAICAFLRMPVGDAVADNFAVGGLLSVVDVVTGELGPGVFKRDRNALVRQHPDTGAVFAGRKVPRWTEVMQLCLSAHATVPWLRFVSWDAASTAAGPLLVEANHHGVLAEFQGVNGRPLAESRFPEVLLSHRFSDKKARGSGSAWPS